MKPSWRKPAGTFMILALIAIWAILVASLADTIVGWPVLAQMAFYLVTGVIWIGPLGPLLRWIETGRWR